MLAFSRSSSLEESAPSLSLEPPLEPPLESPLEPPPLEPPPLESSLRPPRPPRRREEAPPRPPWDTSLLILCIIPSII
jgi:hypothetical protein